MLLLPLASSLRFVELPCSHPTRSRALPAASLRMCTEPGTVEEKEKSRQGVLWARVRERLKRDKGVDATTFETISPLVEGVSEEIEQAVAARRRRLDAKLGSSLRTFKVTPAESRTQDPVGPLGPTVVDPCAPCPRRCSESHSWLRIFPLQCISLPALRIPTSVHITPFRPHLREVLRASGRAGLVCAGLRRRIHRCYSILRFASLRFDSIRFDPIRFDSIRFYSILESAALPSCRPATSSILFYSILFYSPQRYRLVGPPLHRGAGVRLRRIE